MTGQWRTVTPARPLAPHLTLSMELLVGVARLSCRYPLAFSQTARLARPDSAFPRPSRARAALKECRAALGRGLLSGPGWKGASQIRLQALLSPPALVLDSWGSNIATPTTQSKSRYKQGAKGPGWGQSSCTLTQSPAGHGAGAPPAGTAALLLLHHAAASG